MKKYLITVAALLMTVAVAGLGVGTAGLATAESRARSEPRPTTIVEVTGDKANGFGIHRYDGSTEFPPTDSEARAECSEYDTRVARVRCRSEVRVWYSALGDLKRSINYTQSLND